MWCGVVCFRFVERAAVRLVHRRPAAARQVRRQHRQEARRELARLAQQVGDHGGRLPVHVRRRPAELDERAAPPPGGRARRHHTIPQAAGGESPRRASARSPRHALAVRVRHLAGQCGLPDAAHRHVLPLVLRLREHGVRPADAAQGAQLASALQVLPLVAVAARPVPLLAHHVHRQVVLRHRGHLHRHLHLQVHRVQGRREGVGRRHTRPLHERRSLRPPQARGLAATRQELASADPTPTQVQGSLACRTEAATAAAAATKTTAANDSQTAAAAAALRARGERK